MFKRVISVELSESGIAKAIKEIKSFERDFVKKVSEYRKRLGEEIASEAQTGFNSSMVDDIIKGGSPHTAQVDVSVTDDGTTIIIADGEDAVWCEFGAGVFHNGSAGSSPNPYGADVGLTIGSYGQGKGSQTAWGFYDEDKNLIITRGTVATMPMYKAVQAVSAKAVSIAKEVFGE